MSQRDFHSCCSLSPGHPPKLGFGGGGERSFYTNPPPANTPPLHLSICSTLCLEQSFPLSRSLHKCHLHGEPTMAWDTAHLHLPLYPLFCVTVPPGPFIPVHPLLSPYCVFSPPKDHLHVERALQDPNAYATAWIIWGSVYMCVQRRWIESTENHPFLAFDFSKMEAGGIQRWQQAHCLGDLWGTDPPHGWECSTEQLTEGHWATCMSMTRGFSL